MKKSVTLALVCLTTTLLSNQLNAYPSVYPTGTTIYQPDKTWNGYVLHDAPDGHGAVLIDMNGNVVRQWKSIASVPGPFRILPGGFVMGGDTPRRPHQEAIALIQLDWEGNEVWRFDQLEQVLTEETENDAGETVGGETDGQGVTSWSEKEVTDDGATWK